MEIKKELENSESITKNEQERSNQLHAETEKLVLEETIKKLEERSKAQEQTIFYLKADIENIKKNTFKEIQLSLHRSNVKILSLFLSVIDDYERSLEYAKQNKDIYDGLAITHNAFMKVLKDLEIEEIETKGEFNPELHEAISSIEASAEKKENNTIATVVQKGYLYKKQVIRPAKVIVVI